MDGHYEAPRHHVVDPEPSPEPVGAYLRSITVAGFRGIGPERMLELHPGPGLTIVAGRNGSGKSSFAEALEVALTGDSSRRRLPMSEWVARWTNLHSDSPRMIRVELAEDDVGITTVGVDWPADVTAFDQHRTWVQRPAQKREPGVECLGWSQALQNCSPLLPHEELGRLLTASPNELYNKLESILGLGRFADAQDRLNTAYKDASEPEKRMKAELTGLKKALKEADDERAAAAHSYLSKRPPRRAELRALATGTSQPGAVTSALADLATLSIPDRDAIMVAVDKLRAAVAAVPEGADAASDVAARRSRLLREALDLHAAYGDRPCPVCGGAELDADWRVRVEQELADTAKNGLVKARAEVADRRRDLEALMSDLRVPEAVAGVELTALGRAHGVVTSVLTGPEDHDKYAEFIATHVDELVHALTTLRDEAERAVAERQSVWLPLATRIGAWLHLADQADGVRERAALVGAARTWLRNNVELLRNQQFEPLAARTAEIWDVLRQESNVDIARIRLPNPTKNNQRRVDVVGTVDGVEAGAFSVMSTGELHAITLALFLPRATRAESPFRFVVLDDPVQAMDPSKIDGLVDVLTDVARTRQVIVFTHDDRLAESARRLAPRARIVQVHRAEKSVVTIDKCSDPAARYLADAESLAADPNVPDDVRRLVIPQLCRQAFESAARDAFFARAFTGGRAREAVEVEWEKVRNGPQRVALALHANPRADVKAWIRQRPWRDRGLGVCGKGSHEGIDGDLCDAIADVRKLVDELRSSK
ncbi:MAG: AAA family ATPase [Pseudonocardia sp.]